MFWETYPQLEDLSDRLADLDDGGAALEFLDSAGGGVESGYLGAVTETVRRWLEQMPDLLESADGSWLYGWDARPAGRCYAVGAKIGGREGLAGEYLDWLRFTSFVPGVWDLVGVYPLDKLSLVPPNAIR